MLYSGGANLHIGEAYAPLVHPKIDLWKLVFICVRLKFLLYYFYLLVSLESRFIGLVVLKKYFLRKNFKFD